MVKGAAEPPRPGVRPGGTRSRGPAVHRRNGLYPFTGAFGGPGGADRSPGGGGLPPGVAPIMIPAA